MHALLALVCGGVILGVEYGLLLIPFGAGQGFPALYPEAWATTLEEAATVAGLAMGLWIGLAVESRHVRFSVVGPWWQRALRYLIGVAVLLGIWLGLRAVFPQQPLPLGLGLRVVRYGLAMAWAIVGWPWLFVRIGLGQREPRPQDAGPVDPSTPPRSAGAIPR